VASEFFFSPASVCHRAVCGTDAPGEGNHGSKTERTTITLFTQCLCPFRQLRLPVPSRSAIANVKTQKMSASFFQKFNSLLPRPDSYHDLESYLDKNPRLWSLAAVAVTLSVMSTGAVVLFFTGKQFLVVVVSAVILAPFVGAAMGGLITLYLKWLLQTPRPATAAPYRNQTVLLLEADPSLREIIQEGLTDAGFHLICSPTAKHAARICRDHGDLMDLLLADTNALGGRPLDCLQTIKVTQPDLPVLLFSAYDRQTLCEQDAQLLASCEFLPLPFEFPHLTETIHTLLQLQPRPITGSHTKGA